MKKIAIIAVILGILISTAFFLMKKGDVSNVVSNIQNPLGGSSGNEFSPDSFVKTLNSNQLFFAVVTPKNIQPIVDHFNKNIRGKLSQTALWKKLDLDTMLDAMAKEKMDSILASEEGQNPLAEFLKKLPISWSSIKEFGISLVGPAAPDADPSKSGMPIPRLLVAAHMNDQAETTKLKEYFDTQLLAGKSSVTNGFVTLSRTDDNHDRYLLSSSDEAGMPGMKLEGSVEFRGALAYVSLFTNQLSTFLVSPDSADSFLKSKNWGDLSNSTTATAATFAYLNLPEIGKIVNSLAAMALDSPAGSSPDMVAMKAALDSTQLQNLGPVALSFDFNNGISSKSCIKFDSKPPFYAIYEKTLASRGAGKGGADNFSKVISGKTVFAISVDGSMIENYLEASKLMTASIDKEASEDPEIKRLQQNSKAVAKLLSRYPVESVGALLNAPKPEQLTMLMQGGAQPTPDVGLYFEFKNAITTQQLAELINNIATILVADSGLVELPIAVVNDHQQVVLSFGHGVSVLGTSVSSNAVFFAKDAGAIAEAKDAISKAGTVIKNEALETRGMKDPLGWYDYYTYFSLAPVIEIGRSFVPMGIMFAPPQFKITLQDAEEVLNILNIKLFSIQNSAKFGDGLYCGEGHGVAL